MPTGLAIASIGVGALSASQSGKASASAARAQQRASEAGIAEERRQFDVTQEQFAPFREAGVLAIEEQKNLIGLGGRGNQFDALRHLERSPGQEFIRKRQERALLRNTSAIGGLGGGNIRTALQQQAAGFAQQDIANQFNRLGAISGGGQAATSNVAQLGGQSAGNIAALQSRAGASRASGILGANQAQNQFLSQVGGGIAGAGLGSQGLLGQGVGGSTGFLLGSQ